VRLTYIYLAARLLEKRLPEDITQDVLKHLQNAQETIQRAWGASEFARLALARLGELDPTLRDTLRQLLDDETYTSLKSQPLQSLSREQILNVMDELGRRSLTEVYRQLLLGVITELWVDYLTQMEALRISVGLEAYGQRDPLVQYKRQAFEKFQNLLKDMRSGVISRMFIYRPRDLSTVQSELQKIVEPEEAEEEIRASLEESAAILDGDGYLEAEVEGDGTAEAEEEQEAVPGSQPQLSRSQKRRRHRK
jgi:preprotein translocase subunit SecA